MRPSETHLCRRNQVEPGEIFDLDAMRPLVVLLLASSPAFSQLPASTVDVKPYAPVTFKVEQDGTIDLT